jgi:hypothetical protein
LIERLFHEFVFAGEGISMNGSSDSIRQAHRHRCHRRKALHVLAGIASCVVLMLTGPWPGSVACGADLVPPAGQIVREYRYDANREAPAIEQRISDAEGTSYLLRDVSEPVVGIDNAPLRQFTATVERPITPEQESQGEAAVRRLFAEALSVSTEDYAGVLRIQSLSIEPVYRSMEEQIERIVVYPDLASEDVLQLPEHESFTVTSDEELGATVTQELRRVAVSWQTTGFDEDGRPSRHEASVVFRGTQRQLVLDYHVATVVYAGTVPARSRMESVFATYETEPTIAPVPSPPSVAILPLPDMGAPLGASTPPLPLALIVGIAVAVMLLALLGFLYFFLYRNARLVRVSATGGRRVLVRRHLRLEKGEAVFRVDPSQGLYREAVRHLVVLNRPLASRQGHLTVLWGDRLILRVSLRRETDITEELVKALEGELADIAWEGVGVEREPLGRRA